MRWHERYNGVLLLDKPSGITSHDAVQRVRRILQQREVGHTGTLDPLATGLLVLCIGKATKVAQFISGMDKVYIAEVCLGIRSTTYDAEGIDDTCARTEVPALSRGELDNLLAGFLGRQQQQVPAHSAVRINGQHLYELARQGTHITLPEREIEISSIRLLDFQSPVLRIEVACSKGTYIRTLANEIGERIGCGAHLASLRRISVGPFGIESAGTLEELAAWMDNQTVQEHLLAIEQVLDFGAVRICDQFETAVSYGRAPQWQDVEAVEGSFEQGDRVVIKSHLGRVLAIAIAGGSSREFLARTGRPVESYVRVLA